MTFELVMHHIDFCSIFFVLTCSLPLVFLFYFLALCLGPYPSTMPRKTRANRTPSTSSEPPSRSEVFRNDKSRETFENLNSKRNVETSPPSSTGADATETSGATAVDADVPPSTTSDDSDIRRTLDHVLTVHAAHG